MYADAVIDENRCAVLLLLLRVRASRARNGAELFPRWSARAQASVNDVVRNCLSVFGHWRRAAVRASHADVAQPDQPASRIRRRGPVYLSSSVGFQATRPSRRSTSPQPADEPRSRCRVTACSSPVQSVSLRRCCLAKLIRNENCADRPRYVVTQRAWRLTGHLLTWLGAADAFRTFSVCTHWWLSLLIHDSQLYSIIYCTTNFM